VLGCILDLIVCGREEDGASRLSSVPATTGIQPGHGRGWSGVGVRLSEIADGNESVLTLLKYVCKVLGINIDAVRLLDIDEEVLITSAEEAALNNINFDDDAAAASLERCGWPEIQVGVVREAVAVAEALPGWYFQFDRGKGNDQL
jgi:hypothetical protein